MEKAINDFFEAIEAERKRLVICENEAWENGEKEHAKMQHPIRKQRSFLQTLVPHAESLRAKARDYEKQKKY